MTHPIKNPIPIIAVTVVVLIVLAFKIGNGATSNLRSAEYRDCTQRNTIIDQQNRQGQGISIILEQSKTFIEQSPNQPLPPGITKQQILDEYTQLINAEAPLPHFNCDIFKS